MKLKSRKKFEKNFNLDVNILLIPLAFNLY